MRRALTFIGLELYALLLAYAQYVGGVRTDEAKYLLNIPYPHPPLVRWVLNQTEFLPFQEMLWRVVFATVLVQSVWLLWSTSPFGGGQGGGRRVIGIAWLFCAAVIFQAGSIMMAPLTAVQGLILVCVYFWGERGELRIPTSPRLRGAGKNYELWIGLFWLVSLFTAYQAVLYAPIVIAIFWRMRIPFFHKIVYIGGPLFVLAFYTLTNPLVVASMELARSQNVELPWGDAFGGALMAWTIAGSMVVSVLGTIGMVKNRDWPLVVSLVLVFLFILVSHHSYYAILFTPLLVGGFAYVRSRAWVPLFLFVSAILVLSSSPFSFQSIPRVVLQNLPHEGVLLIEGDFGHEWQYFSRIPIRRFRASDAVVRPVPLDELRDAIPNLRFWTVPK